MYQIFQNDRPTPRFYHSLSDAQRFANLENMGSDCSTFSVRRVDTTDADILLEYKHVTICR